MDLGRIGILVPSANTVLEDEARLYIPPGRGMSVARVRQQKLTSEALERMTSEAKLAAELLADAKVKSILYGITAPSFMFGSTYDEAFIADVEKVTQIKTTTVAQAILNVLKGMKIKRVALATPYAEPVTLREVEFLSLHGFTVTNSFGLGHTDVATIGSLPIETVHSAAQSAMSGAADALVLSCTNWRTYEAVKVLEQRYAIPVVTSNKAGISYALSIAS